MGMSRQHPRRDLFRLVEGGLDPAARARVEQHVADCAACQTELSHMTQTVDSLRAIPHALHQLTAPSPAAWPAVWARMQRVPVRRMAPHLNLVLSLAAVVFVLAAALPSGLGVQPMRVTAGANQTPQTVLATPSAGKAIGSEAVQVSTALAASHLATGARALPAPTPIPGQGN